MENEGIKDIAQKEAEGLSKKELEKKLNQINDLTDKITRMQGEAQTSYFKSKIRIELKKILEVLPKEIKVLSISKDVYVSRATEEDKVITVWHKEELDNYTKELETVFASKVLGINKNFPMKWE